MNAGMHSEIGRAEMAAPGPKPQPPSKALGPKPETLAFKGL